MKKKKIIFPRISLSKLKEKEFKDKFFSEKYFYASIKLTVSIEYNDRYFDGIDKEIKEKYSRFDLIFNYSPS